MVRKRFEVAVECRQKRIRLSPAKLARWIEKMLGLLGWKRVGLSVVITNDSEIRRLHGRYLGDDRPTDVLAFGQAAEKFFPQRGVPFLGDVVVSAEMARRIGPRFGNRWDEELLLYLCHGVLHLMGYRDSTPQRKAHMEAKQQRILRKLLGRQWRSKKRKPLF